MKLDIRDFYYLDSDWVDSILEYVSDFAGEDHFENKREEETNEGEGSANILGVQGEFDGDSTTGIEVARKGTISPEIRFKKLLDILTEFGLPQIKSFDSNLWSTYIEEGEDIEITGSIKFTEVYNLEQQASLVGNLGDDLGFIDKDEAKKVINQITKNKDLQKKDGFPVIIETLDSKYKFVTYLNDKLLVKGPNDITGNDYKILCETERIIPTGETYELFDTKELARRETSEKSSFPKEFKEAITGPAAIMLPIAIYK